MSDGAACVWGVDGAPASGGPAAEIEATLSVVGSHTAGIRVGVPRRAPSGGDMSSPLLIECLLGARRALPLSRVVVPS